MLPGITSISCTGACEQTSRRSHVKLSVCPSRKTERAVASLLLEPSHLAAKLNVHTFSVDSLWCPSVNSFKFPPCDHTPPRRFVPSDFTHSLQALPTVPSSARRRSSLQATLSVGPDYILRQVGQQLIGSLPSSYPAPPPFSLWTASMRGVLTASVRTWLRAYPIHLHCYHTQGY
jgi:hypothetical protein